MICWGLLRWAGMIMRLPRTNNEDKVHKLKLEGGSEYP